MRNLMANATAEKVTVGLTTGIGTFCFPHLFPSTAANKTDDSGNPTGEKSYDIQLLIPKSDRESINAILTAIKTVGEAKWGANWKKVRSPLRDGDAEADDVTEDGKTKGEKYPERLGHFFLNARSGKPVTVVGRDRSPITEPSDVYGGAKGRISVNFYAYAKKGNSGIAAGLNGVQKIADGEPFGGGAPPVESMFDVVEGEDDFSEYLDEGKGKKGKGKKDKPAPEPEPKAKKSKKGK